MYKTQIMIPIAFLPGKNPDQSHLHSCLVMSNLFHRLIDRHFVHGVLRLPKEI